MKGFGFTPHSQEIVRGREFICSEYAYECYKSVGINIDYDPLGFVSPADFAKTAAINAISFINTQ